MVTLLEGGDRTIARTGSQALFPRPYRYAEDATGLLEVPVPVWATRSFTASWRGPVRTTRPSSASTTTWPDSARHRDGEGLVGRLTNNLPVDLHGVALFYQEKWYYLGTLAPGESRRVELLFARDAQGQNRQISQWFTDDLFLAPGCADLARRAGRSAPLSRRTTDRPTNWSSR